MTTVMSLNDLNHPSRQRSWIKCCYGSVTAHI